MLIHREVILAKVEATYNTDPTPSASTDAVLVQNPSLSFNANYTDRTPVKPAIGKLQGIYGGKLAELSFDVLLRGSGTAGSVPEVSEMLQACGMGETIVGATSVTYAPASTAITSITLYYYQDGKLHKLTGARGTFTATMTAGAPITLSFSFTGHHSDSDSAIASPTYDSVLPEPVVNGAFSVDSYSAIVAELSFDMGVTVSTPQSVSSADGYGEVRVTDRNITGSFDPEEVVNATYDFLNKFETNANGALTIGSIGATAGNIIDIDMPVVYYREIGQGDRDGIRTLSVGYGAAESSGDDEISIAFT